MKGINIKDRNYVLFSGTRSAGKTEEEYFRELMHIIPHEHPFILSSKEIYDYVTKLLKIKKEVREYIMTELITEWDIKNDGHVSGSDLPVDAITPILDILDKDII